MGLKKLFQTDKTLALSLAGLIAVHWICRQFGILWPFSDVVTDEHYTSAFIAGMRSISYVSIGAAAAFIPTIIAEIAFRQRTKKMRVNLTSPLTGILLCILLAGPSSQWLLSDSSRMRQNTELLGEGGILIVFSGVLWLCLKIAIVRPRQDAPN